MQSQHIDGYRLSPQQARLWRLQREGGEGAFRVLGVILIDGAIAGRALEEAVGRVVARHEILRTTFHAPSGMSMPLQAIGPSTLPPFQTVDLSHLGQDSQIAQFIEDARALPFDFSQGPLLQVRTVALSPIRRAMLVCLPGLCADATTLHTVFNQLVDELEPAKGAPSGTSPQYADLAEWENELLASDAAVAAVEFWRAQMTPTSLEARLPFERPRRDSAAFEPCWMAWTLPPAAADLVRRVVAAQDVSLAAFFLGCWRTLLWRLTGSSDLTIAAGCHGRTYDELVLACGPLSKYLPVRIDCDTETTFVEVMQHADRVLREAFDQQEYFSWNGLTEPVGAEDHTPFLPFGFDYGQIPPRRQLADGVTLSLERLYHCTDRFKTRVSVDDRGDLLSVALYYDSNAIEHAHAAALMEQFQCVVRSAADRPTHCIADLNVLTEAERQRLLVAFNDTQAAYPADRRIVDLMEEAAAHAGQALAVVAGDARLTYAQLHERANRLARYLQKRGVSRGTLVGLHVDQSVDVLVGLLGILKAGGAYVPIDPEYPQERIELILQDTRAPLLLTTSELSTRLAGHDARAVCVDVERDVIEGESAVPVPPAATSEDLAYVIYTSGSTGRPKGVPITHRNLVHSTSARTMYYRDPVERYLLLSSFGFDSSVAGIFWTLCQGGTLILAPEGIQRDPDRIVALVEREAATHLLCLPTLYSLLLAAAGSGRLASLRTVIVAGEACPADLVRTHKDMLPQATLFNEYGPTEGTVWSTVYNCQLHESDAPVPIGRPIPNVQVFILDRRSALAPIGVPGELYIGGAGVADGYLNRPDLTAEKFVASPFARPNAGALRSHTEERLYRTGDLARYLPDGNIEFLGRIDQQVKIRGYRVELGEIEAVLARHPDVRQSVVAAREDPSGKRLVAYVVPVDRKAPAVDTLRQFLAASVPDFMVPSSFVFLEELPLNANGKVDRQALPEPGRDRPELARMYAAPRNAVEEVLAGLWASVLDLDRVGIHDNFFDLGGHSILVTRMVGQLRNTLREDVALRAVFETPTIAGLAETLLGDPDRRARIEKVAELLVQIDGLAEDQVERMLNAAAPERRAP